MLKTTILTILKVIILPPFSRLFPPQTAPASLRSPAIPWASAAVAAAASASRTTANPTTTAWRAWLGAARRRERPAEASGCRNWPRQPGWSWNDRYVGLVCDIPWYYVFKMYWWRFLSSIWYMTYIEIYVCMYIISRIEMVYIEIIHWFDGWLVLIWF